MPLEITRRRPIATDLARDMVPLRTMMDRLFENAFMPSFVGDSRAFGAAGAGGWFGADVDEDDNSYYISCHLPGVDVKDVNISAHGNTLTISGETKRAMPDGRRAVSQETSYGRFERQFTFDTPLEAGKAEATYRDGILEVTLPKAETHKPRTIQIKPAAATK